MYDFKISKDGKTLESCNTFGWYDSEGIVITVPNGIEVIGRYCFYQNNVNDCWMIKEIVLPNSIKKIEEKAFSHNYKLSRINIPENVESIGSYAFEECRSLQSIILPQTIQVLEDGVFCGCPLKNLIIPPTVKKIGKLSFAGITVKELYVPEGVVELDESAFFHSKELECIYLPSTLKIIEPYVFRECEQLRKIYINPNSEYFVNCDDIIYNFDKTKVICGTPASNNVNVRIPSTVNTICCSAFWYSKMKSINLPFGLKSIESNAFYGCKNLKFIYIPDSVINYGGNCFAYSGIECFRLPPLIQKIPRGMFRSNPLKSIEIPHGVSIIEEGAFCGTNIERVCIPSSVKIIGKNAFLSCKMLREIFISDGVEVISDEAFSGCESLETITIPQSVKEITGNNTFALCHNLRKIICYSANPQCERLYGMSSFFFSERFVTLYVPKKYLTIYIKNGFSKLFREVVGI